MYELELLLLVCDGFFCILYIYTLYIMLTYLMLFAALLIAVYLYNAYFLPLTFSNAFLIMCLVLSY